MRNVIWALVGWGSGFGAGGTCDISRLQIVENLDSLLKMFSILKSSIQSTGIQKSSNHIFEEYLCGIR